MYLIKLLPILITFKISTAIKCYSCFPCAATKPNHETLCPRMKNYCMGLYLEVEIQSSGVVKKNHSLSCHYFPEESGRIDWDKEQKNVCEFMRYYSEKDGDVQVCLAKFCQEDSCNFWSPDDFRKHDRIFEGHLVTSKEILSSSAIGFVLNFYIFCVVFQVLM